MRFPRSVFMLPTLSLAAAVLTPSPSPSAPVTLSATTVGGAVIASYATDGEQAAGSDLGSPVASGSIMVFYSKSQFLGPANNTWGIYERNLSSGVTQRVDVNAQGQPGGS